MERARRFEGLVEEVYEPLQRFLRRRAPLEQAEDALSETLLVVWRRLDDIPDTARLAWCYGVARHALANQRRGERRRLRLVDRVAREPSITVVDLPTESGDPELMSALASIAPEHREVLRLWAWEQLEPREIAVTLGITPNAVSLKLARAKKALASKLERQNGPAAGHISTKHTEEL